MEARVIHSSILCPGEPSFVKVEACRTPFVGFIGQYVPDNY